MYAMIVASVPVTNNIGVPVYVYYIIIISAAFFFGVALYRKINYDEEINKIEEKRLQRLREQKNKLTTPKLVKENEEKEATEKNIVINGGKVIIEDKNREYKNTEKKNTLNIKVETVTDKNNTINDEYINELKEQIRKDLKQKEEQKDMIKDKKVEYSSILVNQESKELKENKQNINYQQKKEVEKMGKNENNDRKLNHRLFEMLNKLKYSDDFYKNEEPSMIIENKPEEKDFIEFIESEKVIVIKDSQKDKIEDKMKIEKTKMGIPEVTEEKVNIEIPKIEVPKIVEEKVDINEEQKQILLKENYKKSIEEKTRSILQQISFEEVEYNLDNDFSNNKIILLLSPEKTGKTTIAVNLAEEISSRGIKTTLIDTDTKKQDAYYYFNTEEKGCLSKLSTVKILADVYDLGLQINKNLKLFSEHKGVNVNVTIDDIIKLIKISTRHSEVVIVDCANYLEESAISKLIEIAYEVYIVANRQVNMVYRLSSGIFEQRKALQNKKIDLIINMDEEINYFKRSSVISYFKNISSPNNINERFTVPINQTFSIAYDLKSVIIGLTAPRQPAINVKSNLLHTGIKQLADYIIKY